MIDVTFAARFAANLATCIATYDIEAHVGYASTLAVNPTAFSAGGVIFRNRTVLDNRLAVLTEDPTTLLTGILRDDAAADNGSTSAGT